MQHRVNWEDSKNRNANFAASDSTLEDHSIFSVTRALLVSNTGLDTSFVQPDCFSGNAGSVDSSTLVIPYQELTAASAFPDIASDEAFTPHGGLAKILPEPATEVHSWGLAPAKLSADEGDCASRSRRVAASDTGVGPQSGFPTSEEIIQAIPADGIASSEMLRKFGSRVSGRRQDFFELVRDLVRLDKESHRIFIRASHRLFTSTARLETTEARSIYVEGFGEETESTREDIRAYLAPYGPIEELRLRKSKTTKEFTGKVHVVFLFRALLEAFLALDSKPLYSGRVLFIPDQSKYRRRNSGSFFECTKAGSVEEDNANVETNDEGGFKSAVSTPAEVEASNPSTIVLPVHHQISSLSLKRQKLEGNSSIEIFKGSESTEFRHLEHFARPMAHFVTGMGSTALERHSARGKQESLYPSRRAGDPLAKSELWNRVWDAELIKRLEMLELDTIHSGAEGLTNDLNIEDLAEPGVVIPQTRQGVFESALRE